jgi:hypothetical protein
MNDVRAMVAYENHDERGLVLEVGERDEFSIRVRQVKIRCGRAERQHGGWCQSHSRI